MKAVMLSIQPKWAELIAIGKKTVEVRRTKPKIDVPFKCYIYCTKGEHLWKTNDRVFLDGKYNRLIDDLPDYLLDGKVIGEFVCKRIEELYQCNSGWVQAYACLSRDEFFDYLGIPRKTHLGYDKKAYGWLISDLVIYDKPKELSEFTRFCEGVDGTIGCRGCRYYYTESNESIGFYEECGCDNLRPLKRPPQSWCYVEESREKI